MIVVGQNDPAAGANRPYHLADHRQRLGDMFEKEPRVRDIEAAPLVVFQRKGESVSLSQLDQRVLSGSMGQPACLVKLITVALDAENMRPGSRGPGHRTGELGQPATHIHDLFASPETELAQRGLVEQVVQPRQATLLLGYRAVDIVRRLPRLLVAQRSPHMAEPSARRPWNRFGEADGLALRRSAQILQHAQRPRHVLRGLELRREDEADDAVSIDHERDPSR